MCFENSNIVSLFTKKQFQVNVIILSILFFLYQIVNINISDDIKPIFYIVEMHFIEF